MSKGNEKHISYSEDRSDYGGKAPRSQFEAQDKEILLDIVDTMDNGKVNLIFFIVNGLTFRSITRRQNIFISIIFKFMNKPSLISG